MRGAGVLVLAALAGCDACAPPTPPVAPTVSSVYLQLVDAGCMDGPDDAGLQAVAAEHARSDAPAWMLCMFEPGGTVQSCAVPCAPMPAMGRPR